MLFFVWGRRARRDRKGMFGPFTCSACLWSGNFWVDAVQRQVTVFFVPVTRWRTTGYICVCRKCGHGIAMTRQRGDELVSRAPDLADTGATDSLVEGPVDDDAKWASFTSDQDSQG
jgi:hypothetical protein